MNKENILGIIIVILLTILVITLYYDNDNKNKTKETESITKITSETKQIKTEELDFFKKTFIEGCIDNDISKEKTKYCECAFDGLVKKMSKEDIIKQALDYADTGIMPETLRNNMVDIAIECM